MSGKLARVKTTKIFWGIFVTMNSVSICASSQQQSYARFVMCCCRPAQHYSQKLLCGVFFGPVLQQEVHLDSTPALDGLSEVYCSNLEIMHLFRNSFVPLEFKSCDFFVTVVHCQPKRCFVVLIWGINGSSIRIASERYL